MFGFGEKKSVNGIPEIYRVQHMEEDNGLNQANEDVGSAFSTGKRKIKVDILGVSMKRSPSERFNKSQSMLTRNPADDLIEEPNYSDTSAGGGDVSLPQPTRTGMEVNRPFSGGDPEMISKQIMERQGAIQTAQMFSSIGRGQPDGQMADTNKPNGKPDAMTTANDIPEVLKPVLKEMPDENALFIGKDGKPVQKTKDGKPMTNPDGSPVYKKKYESKKWKDILAGVLEGIAASPTAAQGGNLASMLGGAAGGAIGGAVKKNMLGKQQYQYDKAKTQAENAELKKEYFENIKARQMEVATNQAQIKPQIQREIAQGRTEVAKAAEAGRSSRFEQTLALNTGKAQSSKEMGIMKYALAKLKFESSQDDVDSIQTLKTASGKYGKRVIYKDGTKDWMRDDNGRVLEASDPEAWKERMAVAEAEGEVAAAKVQPLSEDEIETRAQRRLSESKDSKLKAIMSKDSYKSNSLYLSLLEKARESIRKEDESRVKRESGGAKARTKLQGMRRGKAAAGASGGGGGGRYPNVGKSLGQQLRESQDYKKEVGGR